MGKHLILIFFFFSILFSTCAFSQKTTVIDFYGESLTFNIPINLPTLKSKKITGINISEFNIALKKVETKNLMLEIEKAVQKLKLNNCGYYMVTNALAKDLYPEDENSRYAFIANIMYKKNIKTVIGYTNTKLYCLIASNRELYQTTYYQIEKNIYYLFYDGNIKISPKLTFFSFPKKDTKSLNIDIINPPKFPYNKKLRQYKFTYNEKVYSGKLSYNINLVNFYNDYPKVIIKTKFDAPIDSLTKSSIIENFKSITDEMGEVETINFLLAFMHQHFEYKTDLSAYRTERNLFAEEFLHYRYSDCEDRAIFFAHLVNILTELDIIGIEYNDHISTAIAFNEKVNGSYYKLNHIKYYSSDPTYINSSVGEIMKGYKQKKAKLIKLDIH